MTVAESATVLRQALVRVGNHRIVLRTTRYCPALLGAAPLSHDDLQQGRRALVQIIELERQPIALKETRQGAYQTKISKYGELSSLLGTLKEEAAKIELPGRMAIRIDPDMTKFENSMNDIVLKNGDALYVPEREDSVVVQAGAATLKKSGIEYSLFPRRAGSWPGVVFTGPPLEMAAGHFGVGRGGGAHAPDEWLLIESSDPRVAGYAQQAEAFVDYLYETARAAKARH